MKNTLVCLLALSFTAAFAEQKPYKPFIDKTSTIEITIPYTLGTHRGKANNIIGDLHIDPTSKKVSKAAFRVNIDGIDMGKAKMNCHLQETLGLNYAVSDFPKEHVCDSKNRLPTTGKNVVAFPDITFTLKKQIAGPTPESILVTGDWNIHGITKEFTFPLEIIHEETKPMIVRAKGSLTFSLKDFDLTVKSFLKISVRDPITVKIDLAFAQM